jgi:hypothetical protein
MFISLPAAHVLSQPDELSFADDGSLARQATRRCDRNHNSGQGDLRLSAATRVLTQRRRSVRSNSAGLVDALSAPEPIDRVADDAFNANVSSALKQKSDRLKETD